MFRSFSSLAVFTLAIMSLYVGRLAADEPIPTIVGQQSEKSVSFERQQFTVSRQKGKILFDGTEIPRPVLENKSKEIRLIEIFDGVEFPSDKQFLHWANKLRGTRTYTYDVVTIVGADGNTLTQPLVFFDKAQRTELDKEWIVWLDKRQALIEEASRIRLAKEQEAKRYQQQAQLQELQTQVLKAQAAAAEKSAESLAVISGATSLWEVELVPTAYSSICSTCAPSFSDTYFGSQATGISFFANGESLTPTFGTRYDYGANSNSIFVRAYGRTSQVAGDNAISSHPGYRIGSVRKLAGF